jgi:hypothetical protein
MFLSLAGLDDPGGVGHQMPGSSSGGGVGGATSSSALYGHRSNSSASSASPPAPGTQVGEILLVGITLKLGKLCVTL